MSKSVPSPNKTKNIATENENQRLLMTRRRKIGLDQATLSHKSNLLKDYVLCHYSTKGDDISFQAQKITWVV
jgi:hypothetical protein